MPANVSDEQEQALASLAKQAIDMKTAGSDTSGVENEIDSLVCDLYGIVGEGKEFICSYLSHGK